MMENYSTEVTKKLKIDLNSSDYQRAPSAQASYQRVPSENQYEGLTSIELIPDFYGSKKSSIRQPSKNMVTQ